jgi:hypothetical protein
MPRIDIYGEFGVGCCDGISGWRGRERERERERQAGVLMTIRLGEPPLSRRAGEGPGVRAPARR